MELKDLVGKHLLDAIDFSNERFDEYEDSQVCRFRLDGKVYSAIEDPSDGYRSSMRELIVDKITKMDNHFSPVEVVAVHRTGNYENEDDILELINISTGKVILEVGTVSVDDYYPTFIANFHPEAIPRWCEKDQCRPATIERREGDERAKISL